MMPVARWRVAATQLFPLMALGLLLATTPVPVRGQAQDTSVVGVLRYDNNSGDPRYDHLGKAFSSMMISDLSVIERLRLIERERLEELMAELDLQYSGRVDEESAQSLGMILGAEYLVLGSFITVDPEIRMNTRVARVETTEIVTTAEVTGNQDALFDLQQALADQIVDGLELVLTEEEQRLLSERQQENRIDDMEVLIGYSEALCLIDEGNFGEALDVIQDVQGAGQASGLVSATLDLLRNRAVESGTDRLRNEARGRLGGLLGRREPEPTRPPSAC
jgi:TolB-like protein